MLLILYFPSRGVRIIWELVARAGFEPAISALRGQCPKPLDERAYKFIIAYAKIEFIFNSA